MKFDANIPIYLQIIDDFKKQLAKGAYQKGDKVPSVRDLAVSYGVNPNTVQRSLSELEREGLLFSERTSGRYITQEESKIQALTEEYANSVIDRCIHDLHDLGIADAEMVELIQRRMSHE